MTEEEKSNIVRALARQLLTEFASKENKLSYRQLLDKYAPKAALLLQPGHETWLHFNVIVHQVRKNKH
ncbi:hypothetical protein NGK36_17275 [Hafnia alvei]|uniref:hypothetical protein n=1 Tax=Hafnia alvei TaxID=569 RepID=UPI002DBE8657|nr:hypothetical protein [Hafnia alvei]MEB7891024.1 hypothetical protein [Hafnia alvei]